jgi:hypothetical protein
MVDQLLARADQIRLLQKILASTEGKKNPLLDAAHDQKVFANFELLNDSLSHGLSSEASIKTKLNARSPALLK